MSAEAYLDMAEQGEMVSWMRRSAHIAGKCNENGSTFWGGAKLV